MSGPSAAALAKAALSLIGAPWCLHGRDPVHGLDCIGLLEAALARAGATVKLPSGYPLRLSSLAGWLPDASALGFAPAAGPDRAGDVILIRPGPAQFHLAIAVSPHGSTWVHAHAGLRRVVCSSLPEGPRCGHWRLIET